MSDQTDPEQRTAELEQQLREVRKAALSMVIGMADAVVKSPEDWADLAQGFEELAEIETGETQHMAELVATALRAKA